MNIIVTGGTRGIGEAVVRRLAKDGHAVMFLYKEQIEKAHSMTRVLQAEGCEVHGIQCDVRDSARVQKIVDYIRDFWGHIDVLINCAGISWNGLLQDMLDQEWQELFDTNVNGTFYCTRAVLLDMIARHHGVILNISSIWGSHPGACEVAYSATKGAVEAFTRSLAEEVAYSGIRVNALAPGVVHTDMVRKLGEDTLQRLNEDMPMGRYATPEEIAEWVRFLIGDEASYMTGQVVTVAGGFVI